MPYELSPQQKHTLELWKFSKNIRTIAVAGAGKSTLILKLCENTSESCCVTTYNKTLQEELIVKLNDIGSQSSAYTFHGLASEHYGHCHNDTTLAKLLESNEPIKPFLFKKIIIDESQDMKRIYFELLKKLVGGHFDDVQICIVGDPEQMLYDYDPDDPAVLDYINNPDKSFNVPFEKTTLSKSFRLTPHVASLSNAISNPESVKIESGNTYSTNEPVDLQICNHFLWPDIAFKWLVNIHPPTRAGNIHILASYRKGNSELKKLVNKLAQYGYAIYVHIDDPVSNKKLCNVSVMSWHSSKGSESDTTIILGVGSSSQHNPLHVALTRSRHRLLILADRENILPQLANIVLTEPEYINLLHREETIESAKYVIDNLSKDNNKDNPPDDIDPHETDKRERGPNLNPPSAIIKDVTNWEPLGREYRLNGHIQLLGTEQFTTPQHIPDDEECIVGEFVASTGCHYLRYAMIRNEFRQTRNVRMHDFTLNPIPGTKRKRNYLENIHEIPRAGTNEFDLLPPYALSELKNNLCSLQQINTIVGWMTLAVMQNVWSGYHNKTQLHLPVENWINEDIAITAERTLYEALPSNIVDYNGYARFNRSPKLTYKSRYFAKGNGIVYQCVFDDDISYQTLSRLALPAIFLNEKLKIINIKTGFVYFYEFPCELSKTLEAFNL